MDKFFLGKGRVRAKCRPGPSCHPGFIPGSVVLHKKQTPQQVRGDSKKSPG